MYYFKVPTLHVAIHCKISTHFIWLNCSYISNVSLRTWLDFFMHRHGYRKKFNQRLVSLWALAYSLSNGQCTLCKSKLKFCKVIFKTQILKIISNIVKSHHDDWFQSCVIDNFVVHIFLFSCFYPNLSKTMSLSSPSCYVCFRTITP